MAQDEILTIPEVAELLKIAQKTVYVLAQRRQLPAFKVGGQWRFSRTAIDEWIESRTASGVEQERSEGAPVHGSSGKRRRR